MAENQMKLVNALFGAWNSHDIEKTVAFYSPRYSGVDISQPEPHSGKDGIRRSIQIYLQAFPDFKLRPEEIIEQGDRVVVVWNAEGTHTGKLMNIPATGKKINARGVSIFTIESDQIKSALYLWDVAAFLREIGLLPELAPVS